MKFGYICVVIGVCGFLVSILGMVFLNLIYIRGIVAMPFLALFGVWLIRRAKYQCYLKSIREWAKNNPEEATKWLEESKKNDIALDKVK